MLPLATFCSRDRFQTRFRLKARRTRAQLLPPRAIPRRGHYAYYSIGPAVMAR